MPVHDLGYREWRGTRVGAFRRWSAIVTTGVALAWKGKLLRRLLLLAWIPVLYVAGILVAIEWAILRGGAGAAVAILPLVATGPEELARLSTLALTDPGPFRGELWTRLVYLYFRTPQPVVMALLVGLVAPPLISRDLRSRAWILYFSRPITRWSYLAGKWAVVTVFLLAITTLPAAMVQLLGIGLAPTRDAILATWALPLRILGASIVLIVPTTVLAVCFSSIWYNTRTATFAWYATWILGAVAFLILALAGVDAAAFAEGGGNPFASGVAALAAERPLLHLLSFHHMLGAVQAWIFGAAPMSAGVGVSLAGLTAITVGAGLLTFRRISAPMQR